MKKLASIFALYIAASVSLPASSAVRLTFAELSRQADQVVAGKIVDVSSEIDSASGLIFSKVTLSVSSAIPAKLSGQAYEFRMIGGEYGGRKLWIADFPNIQAGQEVVLFLARDTSSVFGPTVGLWQGVYFVENDPSAGGGRVLDHMRRPVLRVRGADTVLGLSRNPEAQPATAAQPSLRVDELLKQVLAARSSASGAPALPPR